MQHLEEFIDHNKQLVKNTLDGYKTDLLQFDVYNKKDLEEFTGEDIEKYITHLLSKGYKAKTINRKLVSLKKYLLFLNTQKHLKNNISIYIESIRIQDDQFLDEDQIINSNEYKRLLNQAIIHNDLRAIAIFITFANTGVRISELLQFKGLTYRTGSVTVRGKGRKFRNVLVPSDAIEAIDEYRKQRKHGNDDYIFINDKNEKPMQRQKINEIVSFYGGKARIKKSKTHPHAFRHLTGFTLTEAGLPIDQVATMLGHTNVNTTRIYSKMSKGELQKKSENALKRAYA